MKRFIVFAFLAAGLATLTPGCATAPHETASVKESNGSQLWAQNCARCHNSRSPSSYSDAQWDVAMLHMRVRANLTPTEHKAILEFLRAGN